MNLRRDMLILLALLAGVLAFHVSFKKQPDEKELRSFRRMFAMQKGYENHWAPDFEITLLNGESFRLSDHLGGNVVVLNFWATWCGPCRKEMPELVYFVEQHAGQPVVFVAINVGEPAEAVDRYMRSEEFTFTVGLDIDSEVANQYRIRGLPTTVIISPDGRIRLYESGAIDNADVTLTPVVSTYLHLIKDGRTMPVTSYFQQAPKQLPERKHFDDEERKADDEVTFVPLPSEPDQADEAQEEDAGEDH